MPDLGQPDPPIQPGQPLKLVAAGASVTPGDGLSAWQGKGLAVVKVSIYILICFVTSYSPMDKILGYFYLHTPDKAVFWFLASGFELLLATAMLLLFAKFVEKRSIRLYGFTGCTIGGGIKESLAGMAVAGLMVSIVMLILFLTGSYKVMSAAWNMDFLTFLPFFLVAAMREEVMFRGYVMQTLEKNWGTIGAIVISSLMFGFLHMINFVDGVDLPAKIYSCLCLSIDAGVVFAVSYLVTRRLWFPFGLHFAWNIFEGPIYGTLVSSLNLSKPLLTASLTGPFYLTGGVFGPEASLVEVAICLLLVGLLWGKAMQNQVKVPGPVKGIK